jgi:hypothetical protein
LDCSLFRPALDCAIIGVTINRVVKWPSITTRRAILRALRDAGHRVTNQRLALLSVMREQGGFWMPTVRRLAIRRGEISVWRRSTGAGAVQAMKLVEADRGR